MPPISSPVSGSVAITISAILTRRISSFPLRNTYSSFCTSSRSASISSADGRVDSHNLVPRHSVTSTGSMRPRRNGVSFGDLAVETRGNPRVCVADPGRNRRASVAVECSRPPSVAARESSVTLHQILRQVVRFLPDFQTLVLLYHVDARFQDQQTPRKPMCRPRGTGAVHVQAEQSIERATVPTPAPYAAR